MTLTQLAYFVRIAELQSLSKAAAVLRIAQPALSRQVRNLETELGSPVLARHAKGVSLTAAGEVLLVRARQLLRDAEGARDAVLALAEEPAGRVALGVPTSVSTTLLPPLAAALRAKYPRLGFHFVDGFSAVLHARTLSGDLDLAVLYEERDIGPLVTTPLLAEELMLVGPPGEAVEEAATAEMLAGRTLVVPGRPNRLRLIVDQALAPLAARDQAVLEVDSLPALIAIVQRGEGYTVLPYSTVAAQADRGELKVWPLKAPPLTRTLLLARPVERQATAAVSAVEREIRALARELAPSLRWRPLG